MKIQMKWLLSAIATAAIAACGGGSSDTTEEQATTQPAADSAALAPVKYSTGCVLTSTDITSTATFSETNDITIVGSLGQTAVEVVVDARKFSDAACKKQTQRRYAKGTATLSAETKSLTTDNLSVTKVGRKGHFTIADVSLYGVSLSASPIGAVVNFVVVDEGDKLYFGSGTRDADGYPRTLSARPALKQP